MQLSSLVPFLVFAFCLVAAIIVVVFLVFDMIDKAQGLKKRIPLLEKFLEKKEAIPALLLILILMLVLNGYELVIKELPEVPEPPKVAFPSADPSAKEAQIASLKSQLTAARRVCLTRSDRAEQSRPSLDIKCANLADCPKEELSKRANEMADLIESVVRDYQNKLEKLSAEARSVPEGSPNFAEARATLSQNVRAEGFFAMGKYKKHHSDVIALRKALSDRIGEHNTDIDFDYELAGEPNNVSIYPLQRIVSDLRELAGKVLAVRP